MIDIVGSSWPGFGFGDFELAALHTQLDDLLQQALLACLLPRAIGDTSQPSTAARGCVPRKDLSA